MLFFMGIVMLPYGWALDFFRSASAGIAAIIDRAEAIVPKGTSGITNHELQSKSRSKKQQHRPSLFDVSQDMKAKTTLYFPVSAVLGTPLMPVKSPGKVTVLLPPPESMLTMLKETIFPPILLAIAACMLLGNPPHKALSPA
jgi:hypothetical protein